MLFRTFQQNVSDYHEKSGSPEETSCDRLLLYVVASPLRGRQCCQIQGVCPCCAKV